MDKVTRDILTMIQLYGVEHSKDISEEEMIKAVKKAYISMKNDSETCTKYSSKMSSKIIDLQNELIQTFIKYVRDDVELFGDISNLINKNKDKNIDSDLSMTFVADGLFESTKEGNWLPYTDSYLAIKVGNDVIAESI
ncbi:MAG: hypothetical protein J6D03_00265 [Clostridia bacterium]|nr:hypothetical protein [Clostridia bacterium]